MPNKPPLSLLDTNTGTHTHTASVVQTYIRYDFNVCARWGYNLLEMNL